MLKDGITTHNIAPQYFMFLILDKSISLLSCYSTECPFNKFEALKTLRFTATAAPPAA
jgi:hypothetical protein